MLARVPRESLIYIDRLGVSLEMLLGSTSPKLDLDGPTFPVMKLLSMPC